MAKKSAVIHHLHSNHSEMKIIIDILLGLLIFAIGFGIGMGYKHFQKENYQDIEEDN